MSYRYMRVLVMFDLPVLTAQQRKAYTQFRKHLIKSGFIMLQESIYCKLVQNTTAAEAVIANIKKKKPSEGLIQLLKITERQYSKMEYLVGDRKSSVLDTDDRVVII